MRAFIIAGELSGDKLGCELMRGLRQLRPDISFQGIGGPQMETEGLTSLFPMKELSVMGIAEILPKYRSLKARINQTVREVIATQPDLLITIDSPDFSFRVAKRVKQESSIRTVHYVAPTVWAWRPGRAAKIAGFIDHLLALFPFEPPLFSKHGMACDFVGHPVVAEPVASTKQARDFRAEFNIEDGPLLVVLPGSRRSEVLRLSAVFGEAVARVSQVHADLKVVLPAAAHVFDDVTEAVKSWPVPPIILNPSNQAPDDVNARKRAAFRAADVALAASGTVSLELAAARTPMVIAYRMHWLTFRLIQRMALVDTVTLVNLVSETRVVPEFLGPACLPEDIAQALIRTLATPETQITAMETTMTRLGEGDEAPGLRAARAILSRL